MKHQYFGDVNDYKKYGLLRILSGAGEISTGVCWMLTPPDGRADGGMLSYLEQPAKWRQLDPDLFDHLHHCIVVDGERDVRRIENAEVLPRSSFYSEMLRDSANERRRYFTEMLSFFRDVDLVFFDPDNGLEVPSIPLGRKNSSKYLYWGEFARTYAAGHSVLVYQHFPRKSRVEFVRQIAERMQTETNAAAIYTFQTPHVVFLLASRPEHLAHFSRQASLVEATWREYITVFQSLVMQT